MIVEGAEVGKRMMLWRDGTRRGGGVMGAWWGECSGCVWGKGLLCRSGRVACRMGMAGWVAPWYAWVRCWVSTGLQPNFCIKF